MQSISRRNLLYAFGVTYATPLFQAQTTPEQHVAVVKPGESRFAFVSQHFAQNTACKVTKDDTAGACSICEMDIPHCWANEGKTVGRVILMCHPGGFEKFFDDAAQGPPVTSQDPTDLHRLHVLHAKYGMELLGPPIFPPPTAQSSG